MKVSLFRFKNCLGIDELEVKPGKITLIQGKTGAGKTSILETIEKFFTNKGCRPKFVKGDAEKAETYILLDDGTEMKKTFNQDGKPSYVSVVQNGMSPKNVETFLKSLMSDAQINPIKWMELPDSEQNKAILETIPMQVTREELIDWVGEVPSAFGKEVDLSQHALKVCKDVENYYYEKRKSVNSELKVLKADVENLKKKIPEGYNADEWRTVSLQEKYEAVTKANEINSNRIKCQAQIDTVNTRVEAIKTERDLKVKQLEDEIKRLKADAEERINIEQRNVEIAKRYLEKNSGIDIAPLDAAYKEAEEMKSFIKTYDEWQEKSAKLSIVEKEAKTLTDKIEFMRTKPQMLLSKANMPIEGLSIDAGGNVLINELPIKNLSDGEKMEFVMSIVKATAGPLKLILIDGFEKLSPERQKLFMDNALKDDFHYIVTKVTDSDMQIVSINEEGLSIDAETGEIEELILGGQGQ